ncbi:MAG: hypothetical protein KIT79_14495 [Deltaproteobacteria bacterium]|nr:hypothetical protein [Deltaproteobacteria bacterium]
MPEDPVVSPETPEQKPGPPEPDGADTSGGAPVAGSEGPPILSRIPVPLPRMPKLNLVSTIILLAVTVAAMAFFPLVLDLDRHRIGVAEKASLALGYPVRIRHLSLDFTRGLGVRAQGVSVLSTDGRRTLVRLGAVTVAFDVGDLIDQRFTPRVVRLDAPYVMVERRDGRWRIEGLDVPLDSEEPADLGRLSAVLEGILRGLTIREVEVTGGLFRVRVHGAGEPDSYSFRKISMELQNIGMGAPLKVHAELSAFLNNRKIGDTSVEMASVLPAENLDLAVLPVSIQAALHQVQLTVLPPARAAGLVSGVVDLLVNAGGTLDAVRGNVELLAEGVRGEMPYVFEETFTPDIVKGKFSFAWDGRKLRADSGGIQIGPTDVTFVRWVSDFRPPNPRIVHELEIEFHVRDVDLSQEFNHIPWPIIGRHVSDYCRRQIRREGVATYYRNFLPLMLTRSVDGSLEPWLDFDRFWMEGAIKGLSMHVLPGERLKFSGIEGRIAIEGGNFIMDRLRGRVDDMLDVEAVGGFDSIDRQAKLQLDITGQFPYPALLGLLPNYGFRAVQKVVAPLSGGRGDLTGKARVDYDILKDHYTYSGEMRLSEGNIRLANYPVALDGLSGPIQFTDNSLDLGPLTGRFGDGILSVQMQVDDPNGASPTFDMKVAGEQLALDQILPVNSRLKGKGTVTGSYSTSGRLGQSRHPLKRSASFRTNRVAITSPDIRLPIRDVDCSLRYNTGERSSFGCSLSYGESIARVRAGFLDTPAGPRGDFTIEAPNANLDDLLAAATGTRDSVIATQAETRRGRTETSIIEPPLPDIDDFLARGQFTGIVQVDQGQFRRAPFSELSAQASLAGRTFTLSTLNFAGPGGRYDFERLSYEARPDGARIVFMTPRFDNVMLQPMLEAMGTPTDFVDGMLTARGMIRFNAADQFCSSVEGDLSMQLEGGRISSEYRAFARVASLVNLRLSAYPGGIPFRQMKANFDIRNGLARGRGFVLDTRDFDMKSDSVEIRLCDRWIKSNATVSVLRREFFSRLPLVDLGEILRIPVNIDQSFAEKGD